MNNVQASAKADIKTVSEWQSARTAAVAAETDARKRIADDGSEDAVYALDVAIREIRRIDGEIEHARILEKARADAARAGAARVLRAELAPIEANIESRAATEAEHGRRVATARIELEKLEQEALAYFTESETLLVRRALLVAKIENKTPGHNGLAAASFRLDFTAEVARQRLLPNAAPTEFARWWGAPLDSRPAAPARVTSVTVAEMATPATETDSTRQRRA